MKKLSKIVAGVACVAALAGSIAMAGCAKTEVVSGEYHYNAWNTEYGIKVDVAVKSGVIESVKVVDSDYVSVSDSWTDKAIWNDNLDSLLAKYAGKNVDDVLKQNVTVATNNGQPKAVTGEYVITGATQGSGRLLLAVQDALCKLDGYSKVTGTYEYANPYSAEAKHYGITVNVILKDTTILKVDEAAHDYVSVTDSWTNKETWINGETALLAKYSGKTVAEINAIKVTVDDKKQPTALEGNLMITGATQGSGRLMLAVQDAVKDVK